MKGRQVSKMAGGMKEGDEVKTALLTLKKMRTGRSVVSEGTCQPGGGQVGFWHKK